MSQLSFSSFDAALMVRDSQGHYLPATADQILEAARQAIEHKMVSEASRPLLPGQGEQVSMCPYARQWTYP